MNRLRLAITILGWKTLSHLLAPLPPRIVHVKQMRHLALWTFRPQAQILYWWCLSRRAPVLAVEVAFAMTTIVRTTRTQECCPAQFVRLIRVRHVAGRTASKSPFWIRFFVPIQFPAKAAHGRYGLAVCPFFKISECFGGTPGKDFWNIEWLGKHGRTFALDCSEQT
jgi:hypothetical protein